MQLRTVFLARLIDGAITACCNNSVEFAGLDGLFCISFCICFFVGDPDIDIVTLFSAAHLNRACIERPQSCTGASTPGKLPEVLDGFSQVRIARLLAVQQQKKLLVCHLWLYCCLYTCSGSSCTRLESLDRPKNSMTLAKVHLGCEDERETEQMCKARDNTLYGKHVPYSYLPFSTFMLECFTPACARVCQICKVHHICLYMFSILQPAASLRPVCSFQSALFTETFAFGFIRISRRQAVWRRRGLSSASAFVVFAFCSSHDSVMTDACGVCSWSLQLEFAAGVCSSRVDLHGGHNCCHKCIPRAEGIDSKYASHMHECVSSERCIMLD